MLLKPKMTRHLGRTAIFIQETDKLRGERGRMVHSRLNVIDNIKGEYRVKRWGKKKTFVKQTSYKKNIKYEVMNTVFFSGEYSL